MSSSPFALTARFGAEICGVRQPPLPTRLSAERKEWFRKAVEEELFELFDADSLEEEVDAVIDLIYFACGRLHEMGVDGDRAFFEVHLANMRKVQGELSKRPGSMGHDAVKPEGWVGPDYSWLQDKLRVGDNARIRATKSPVGVVVDIHDNTVWVDRNGRHSHYEKSQLEKDNDTAARGS